MKRLDSLTALFFRLENSPNPSKMLELVDNLVSWFKMHPDFNALKNLFVELLGRGLTKYQNKTNQVRMPEDLLEVKTMLHGLEEYKQKLIEESMQQGRRDEAVSILGRLLQQKFGANSSGLVEEKLSHATLEELESWTGRILSAKSPGDLFIN